MVLVGVVLQPVKDSLLCVRPIKPLRVDDNAEVIIKICPVVQELVRVLLNVGSGLIDVASSDSCREPLSSESQFIRPLEFTQLYICSVSQVLSIGDEGRELVYSISPIVVIPDSPALVIISIVVGVLQLIEIIKAVSTITQRI